MNAAEMLQLASEEEFRIIESIFLANAGGRKSVVFTAPDRGSGCSWIAARVARRLAKHVNQSVCIVDLNLCWPSQHDLFRIENDRGFLQAVAESDPIRDYVEQINHSNLWVLPSGGSVSDSHIILGSEKAGMRLNELKREFDYVLIDTPATKVSADSSLIGRLSDEAVLVIASDSTRRDAAVSSLATLESANVPVVGAVLNKRTYPIPDSIYRYL